MMATLACFMVISRHLPGWPQDALAFHFNCLVPQYSLAYQTGTNLTVVFFCYSREMTHMRSWNSPTIKVPLPPSLP